MLKIIWNYFFRRGMNAWGYILLGEYKGKEYWKRVKDWGVVVKPK